MGEVLGVGITHFPPLLGNPDGYSRPLKRALKSPVVPEHLKDPKSWPAGMQDEWAHETERAQVHQEQMVAAMRKVRQAIDDFNPDAVVVWGDDQYEDFKEDLIPPFNVYCMDEFFTVPFRRGTENMWDEPQDKVFHYKGAGQLAKHIASELIDRDFPVPYSYKPLHFEHGLAHAFANTFIYLDWDRKGWPYPIVPIMVNCIGRDVVSSRGAMGHLNPPDEDARDPFLDYQGPGGPTPRSLFRMGQLIRQICEERPERVVMMASSGWSHGFLHTKAHFLHPDREFDRRNFEDLKLGQHSRWADITNEEMDDAAGAEFKNWICLAGAMEDRTPEIIDYMETWIFNSEKCFAIFKSNGA